MLGTSTLISTTADGAHDGGGEAAQPSTTTANTTSIMIGGGGGGGGGGEDEKAMSQSGGGGGTGSGGDLFESDRSTGGNRWPRQETLALLKIRSDMDVIFRDSSLKGPLWEEVSRKMAELGYHRSAKKCKEKFENVYKYHKRTKDGRVGKSDGKTYRFFDQLEALEQHHMAMAAAAAASQGIPSLPQSSPPQQVAPRVVSQSQSQSQGPAQAAVPVTMVIPAGTNPTSVTVPSSPHPISVVHTTCSISATHPQHQQVQPQQVNHNNPTMSQVPQQQHYQPQQQQQAMGSIPTHSSIQMENPSSPSATQSSSSSTSSDEELLGRSRKRKRKWKDFFEKLMKEVIDKQEELQKRFLEAVEKREHDRVAREEAWKMQEVSRLNREHEILVQERSMAAAKDAALIAFLQKLSDQQQIPSPLPAQVQAQAQGQGQARAAAPVVAASTATTTTQPQLTPQQPPQVQQVVLQPQSQPQPQPQTKPTQVNVTEIPVTLPSPTPTQPLTTQLPQQQQQKQPPQPVSQALVVANTNNGDNGDFQKSNSNNNGDNLLQASSSRWPKAEVQALINLRTNLDQKYQENGPKGPLWEEISSAMKKLGYNRNAKRCKEKWENINKYFKKVKESNKKRPEDSKTCPYFHQLDALYRERSKMEINNPNTNATMVATYGQPQQQMKQDGTSMAPIMAQPEQQWPHPNQGMDDQGSENQDDSDDEGDEEDDDDQGSGYEIVANNNNASSNNNNNNNSNVNAGSMSTTTAATRTATAE